jgi:hypothetical protein
MSERNFQLALLHLYKTIDGKQAYVDAAFEQFALSASQKQWLKELMTSQREALLMFNELLRGKRRRWMRHGLPVSRFAYGGRLDALLNGYVLHAGGDGPTVGPALMRNFAEYVETQATDDEAASRELELIHFEALLASVSLRAGTLDRHLELASDLCLRLGDDAHLVACHYDVVAAFSDPLLLERSPRLPAPQWLLLFADECRKPRTFALAPGLAKALGLFAGGTSLGEVLNQLEIESERMLASQSIAKLLRIGVPFCRRIR